MNKLFLVLVAMVLVSILVFNGCAAPAPAPAPVPSPAPAPKPTLAPSPVASQATAAEFFKGKTVTILNTSKPGGVSDLYVRSAVSFLSTVMDAKVVVVNEDAAAGMAAMNKVYNVSKPDGLTLLSTPQGALFPNWQNDAAGIEYDLTKYEYIGATKGALYSLTVGPKSPYTSVKVLQETKGLKFAAEQPAGSMTLSSCIGIEILGLDAKVITGYATSPARLLALQQGEVDATSQPINAARTWEQQGQAKVLMQWTALRDRFYPDVPCLGDAVKLTDYHKMLIDAIGVPSYLLTAPPGTPPDRVKFLQDSYDAVHNDKSFQDKIKQVAEVWLGYFTGQELKEQALALAKNKKSLQQTTKTLLEKYVKK